MSCIGEFPNLVLSLLRLLCFVSYSCYYCYGRKQFAVRLLTAQYPYNESEKMMLAKFPYLQRFKLEKMVSFMLLHNTYSEL